jgi:hypothetical protein
MREWLLLLAPTTAVIYFLVFPQHLSAVLFWIKSLA